MRAGTHRCSNAARYALTAMALGCAAVCTAACALVAVSKASPQETSPRCTKSAAAVNGWGEPEVEDDFDTPSSLSNWYLYDAAGNAGNGRRTPDAITAIDGTVTIAGDPAGNSGGMGSKSGQLFGRWEVCARSPQSSPGYHSVLLLWPDAEDWPLGGEVDFMEAVEPSRQTVQGWVHYGPDDRRDGGIVAVDATSWHTWAVEWTPERITTFVDGTRWWTTTNTATFPPRQLHLCMQVDNFGGDISSGGRQQVDWVRQYSLT
jgi:hypothetical protein